MKLKLFLLSILLQRNKLLLKIPSLKKSLIILKIKLLNGAGIFTSILNLSNQEFETAEKIAAHLNSLGIETKTGIAKTGVVGI